MKFLKKIRDKFNNASLQAKLTFVFSVTMIMVGAINIYMQISINKVVGNIDKVYESNVSLNDLLDSLEDVQDNMYRYLSTKSTDALDSYYRGEQSYRNHIDMLNSVATDNPQKLSEKNIKNLSEKYLSLTAGAVSAKRGRDVEQYNELCSEATRMYKYLNTYINDLNNGQFKNNSENYGALRSSLKYMQTFSSIILVSAIIGELIVLIVFSGTITRPLTTLAKQAEQVGRGDFDIDFIDVKTNDEVGIMADAFNKMIKSLNGYVDRIKEQMEEESRLKENQLQMENSLKEAQLIFLQSQINPHFLYNTLNAGEQLAMMEGAEKTCLFIEKLADFFRYNVKKTGEVSTLTEEIEQVETYLHIINVRFSSEILYTKEIMGNIDNIAIPGVVIQPLVENAINHGLHETEGDKKVKLTVKEEENRFVVTVEDNGKGMSAKEIDAVLTEDKDADKKRSRGTGLKNVIKRLIIYYGVNDVFEIKSEGKGKGTAVSILIPKGVK